METKACCEKQGENRGAWSSTEDEILINYVQVHGEGNWRDLPERAGLNRCGKSCKFRWLNYLRPEINRGNISLDEEELIIKLHKLLGNRWSLIAGRLPGRTENDIENYWNTYLSKKIEQKHNHNNSPGTSITTPSKSSVQSPSCTKNSLDIEPTESPHLVIIKPQAVRCTRVVVQPMEYSTR